MSSERVIEHVEDGGGPRFRAAQVVALIVGLVFVVLGGVALLRTGVGPDVFEPTTTVAGLSYTPLLGMIEVVFGLLLLAVGAFPGASDGIVFLGLLALAFGLLLVIEPNAFQEPIAAGRAHGWFYVVTGGVAALTGLITPSLSRRRARVVTREEGGQEPPAQRSRRSADTSRSDDQETTRT